MNNNRSGHKRCRSGIGLSLLMLLTLVTGMMPVQVRAATVDLPDIVIQSFEITNKPLYENKSFDMTVLQYRNLTDGTLTNVTVDFSAAYLDVAVTEGGTIKEMTVPNGDGIGNLDAINSPVKLKYIGTGVSGRIPLLFKYTFAPSGGGAPESREQLLYIALDVEASSPSAPGPAPDTTKYKPTLDVSFTGANVTDGGHQNLLTLLVKNMDPSYAAKNVLITLPEGNTYPFSGLAFGAALPIAQINPGATVEIPFHISTDPYVPAGVHKMPLHLGYTNPWSDPFSQDVSLDVTVRNNYTPGLLLVEAGKPNPAVQAGEEFELPLTVRNQGNLPVNNIKINLEGLSADGFMLASGSSRLSWDRIDGAGSKTVLLKLKAGVKLEEGSYAIHFRMAYQDARGEVTEDVQQLWVPVQGAKAVDHSLEVTGISPSRTTMNPSQTVTVTVTVKNSGTSEARQVRVSSEVAPNVFFPASQNLFILKSLAAGEEKKLTFTFQAQADAPRGSAPLTINVEAPSGTEVPYTLSQAVSVFVAGESEAVDASKNVPKIIVYSYHAEPALVTAGDEFDLHLTFMNTHSGKTIRNIKANFTVNEASSETGSVFTPVGSSNTFYVDAIGPKNTVDRTIRLYTIPDAKSKTYNVTVSFGYEDQDGNPYTAEEIIGIPVYQPARFEISEPNYMSETMVGQMMPVSFEMYNLGKNTLFNVKLKVEAEPEGAITFEPKSQYYGNFDTGHNEYAEVMLNPMMPGPVTGRIIVSYESASGEAEEIVKDFSLNVMEMPPFEEPGEVLGPDGKPLPLGPDGMPIFPGEEPQGFFRQLLARPWVLVIVGIVGIAIVVIVIRRIRRKKDEKGLEF